MTPRFLLTVPSTTIYNRDMNAPALKREVPTQQGSQPINGSPVLSYRAQLIQRAQPRVPSTAEGLPVGFYRIDLLPLQQLPEKEEVQSLKNAYTDLSFEYGYPTLPDGRPFWHKLDFEPSFAFGSFQTYLEAIHEGPRELSKLSTDEELLRIMNQGQPLPQGSWTPKLLNAFLYETSILYFWRPRAKAYDVYKEAAYRHLRLKRQMSVEDEHFVMASNLLRELREKVFSQPKFFDNMKPQTAADLLSKLVGIQRVSVGLPAAGPLAQKERDEDTSFEMIVRSLAQKAAGNVYENGVPGQPAGETKGILSDVLKDPEASKNMQELIIRVTRTAQQRLPNPHEQFQGRQFKSRQRAQELITRDDLAGPYDLTGAPGENTPDPKAGTGTGTGAGTGADNA